MKISEPILEAKANFVALHSFLKVYFSEGDKDFLLMENTNLEIYVPNIWESNLIF